MPVHLLLVFQLAGVAFRDDYRVVVPQHLEERGVLLRGWRLLGRCGTLWSVDTRWTGKGGLRSINAVLVWRLFGLRFLLLDIGCRR